MRRPARTCVALTVACLLATTAGCTAEHDATGTGPTASPHPRNSLDQLLNQLPGPSVTPSPPPGGYPGDAGAYTFAAINLWRSKEIVAAYSFVDPVNSTFVTVVAGPYNPDFLTFYQCQSVAGGTMCTYYNPDGDTLQLTVHPELVGQARAIFAMAVTPFGYPANRRDYAMRLMESWRIGNAPAVSRLSGMPGDSVFSPVPPAKRRAAWSFDGPLSNEASPTGVQYQWRDEKFNRVYFTITAPPTVSTGPIHVTVRYLPGPFG
jgi:hypothetical protein